MQQVGHLLDIDCVVEGRGISNLPLVGSYLPLEAFDQVTNGHTTGHSMGINDDVGSDTLARKWHVL